MSSLAWSPKCFFIKLGFDLPETFACDKLHPRRILKFIVWDAGVSNKPEQCPFCFPYKENTYTPEGDEGIVEIADSMQTRNKFVILFLIVSDSWIPIRFDMLSGNTNRFEQHLL